MDHILKVVLVGDKHSFLFQVAQRTITEHHYLHQPVDPRARPMFYAVTLGPWIVGCVAVAIPHATKCAGWWGYPGLPTQWQVVDLCRIWLEPDIQEGGEYCVPNMVPGFFDRKGAWRPTTASWLIGQVLGRVQRDRISLWPPVFPQQPYHIRLVISYHDPKFHRGTIYRMAGAEPIYTDATGPVPGPSGKYGWAWRMPEPDWEWSQIEIARPRNLRLELGER